jgi:hypothetical protein
MKVAEKSMKVAEKSMKVADKSMKVADKSTKVAANRHHSIDPRDRFDYKHFRPKIWRKNWLFKLKLLLVFAKIWSQHCFFRKDAIFFRRKLAKISESRDINIDTRSFTF